MGSPPREELTSPLIASLEISWKTGRCDFGRFLDILLKVKRWLRFCSDPSYCSSYPDKLWLTRISRDGGSYAAPLGGWGCPGPCCGHPTIWDEVALGTNRKAKLWELPCPLAFYQDCPIVGCHWELLSWAPALAEGQTSGLANRAQAAFLPFLLPCDSEYALEGLQWECHLHSCSSHWVVGGSWCPLSPPSLNSLRMVNGQLLGSFIQKQTGYLFCRD